MVSSSAVTANWNESEPDDDKLPVDFDIYGYIRNNPNIEFIMPTDVPMHYINFGRKTGLIYERVIDCELYKELYLEHPEPATAEVCRHHLKTQNSSGYANWHELLTCNNFKKNDWLKVFPYRLYIEHNGFETKLKNKGQAVRHFVEQGIGLLLSVSDIQAFDGKFYTAFHGLPADADYISLYREWVENGLSEADPVNERSFLHGLGLTLHHIPPDFDWQNYLDHRPGLALNCKNRWEAFRHFVTDGALQRGSLPVRGSSAVEVLQAIGDRFAICGQDDNACRVYEKILLMEGAKAQSYIALGDAAIRKSRYERALIMYQSARAAGDRSFWGTLNAATCATSLGEYDVAIEILSEGLQRWPRNKKLTDAALSTITQYHDDASTAFRERLKRNGPDYTDNAIEVDLRAMTSMLKSAIMTDPPLPRKRDGIQPLRVAMLASMDLPQCTFYRVNQKMEQLREQNVTLLIARYTEIAQFKTFASTSDIALFYRVPATVNVLDCMTYCRSIGIPLIYEIDDLIFDPTFSPGSLTSFGGLVSENEFIWLRYGVPLFQYAIRMADFAIVSTDHLQTQISRWIPVDQTAVHRNGLSLELEGFARSQLQKPDQRKVIIFYGSGTKAHTRDFNELVEPALEHILDRHDHVYVTLCGFINSEGLRRSHQSRVEHLEFINDRDAYQAALCTADINLSVLEDTTFNDCKSELKWLEAAAFGIPTIASGVGGFTETLKDQVDILFANSTEEWLDSLHRLIVDPTFRTKIGHSARDRALDLYASASMGNSLRATFERFTQAIPSSRQECRQGVSRVLIVNTYFPPQAIGGGTRVVRDQVDVLLDKYGDKFEVAVVCGNCEPSHSYQMTKYFYRSCQVFQIDTPLREYMDWIPQDHQINAPFEQIISSFKPDLIHFHAIQRLGTSVVDIAVAHRIPYLITVHDAWWLSDHQFLVDGLNRITMPWEGERYGTQANVHTREESGQRKLLAFRCLAQASSVIAVSTYYANIYQRMKLNNVVALPNGVTDLQRLDRHYRPGAKLRLGHIGGTSYHKGLHLFKRAISRGSYDGFEIIVVDDDRKDLGPRYENWGNTEVTIIPPVRQEDIKSLYARMDILVAPSVCPESFGLVTREAMASGLWVIASRTGAIGEDVSDGVDGFLVDVTDGGQDFSRILRFIHDKPRRFYSLPKITRAIRTVADQVTELVHLYEKTLSVDKFPKPTTGKSKHLDISLRRSHRKSMRTSGE